MRVPHLRARADVLHDILGRNVRFLCTAALRLHVADGVSRLHEFLGSHTLAPMKLRLLALTSACLIAATSCCKLPTGGDKESPAPTVAPGEKSYVVNFPCSNDPNLKMTQVVLGPTETRVYLHVDNKGTDTYEISTSPPGQADTFFLEAADQHRHVQLIRSSGIAISPAKQNVRPGGKVDFVLYFPPIDASWGPIDVHEGEVLKQGTTYWNFIDVPLK